MYVISPAHKSFPIRNPNLPECTAIRIPQLARSCDWAGCCAALDIYVFTCLTTDHGLDSRVLQDYVTG